MKDKNKQLKNTLSKSSMEMRNILRIVVYFVYPKKKDAQKLILLMIGFLTGSFFDKGNYSTFPPIKLMQMLELSSKKCNKFLY